MNEIKNQKAMPYYQALLYEINVMVAPDLEIVLVSRVIFMLEMKIW
ncbi:hypothetical protein JCM19236_2149 [Vibrio sp. JCM 19236]|nr:hypothetical protein JCM19236_2149 [Vibrio sp. JCM 19236]